MADPKLVCAIDIGTTYSSYAFQFKHDYSREDPVHKICAPQAWNDGKLQVASMKTPTCLLLDNNGHVDSFGYEAERKFSDICEDEDQDPKDWYFFKRFKMKLHDLKALSPSTLIKDEQNKAFPAIEVFSKSIMCLKDELLNESKRKIATVLTDDILYVLTVPAIWSDNAKDFMRQAAKRAGIKDNRLTISLEPESASLCCQFLPVDRFSVGGVAQFALAVPGTVYMLVDLGDGTADITVQEKLDCGKLREVHRVCGGPWGGTAVDAFFIQVLSNIVSPLGMSEFMNEHCGDYLDLMRDFQVFKRNVDTTSDKAFIISIPVSLSDVSKEYMQKSFSEAVASSAYAGVMKVVGNKLKMSACAARDLFRKVIDKVTRQMEQCIDDVSKIAPARTISLILMVGGFSESPFVQETIKNRFEDVDGMKVLVPKNAGQAVLKGAVIFGRQQDSITSRRMRQGNMATGGTDTCVLSDEIFDLLCTVCKRKGKNTEAEKYCVDCGDYYCLICVKVHDDVPLLNGHKILGKNQFQSMSIRMKPPVPTERCDKHSHKHVDMYCKYHDEVGCSTCMATEHRSCQDTFYIPDFIQNNANLKAANPKTIQQELEASVKTLDEYLDDFQQERQRLLKSKADSIEEIRKFRQEVNARLDEMEQNSIVETEDRFKGLIKEIEDRIKSLQKNKTSVTSAKDKLASVKNNVSQEFVNAKRGRKVASDAKACVEDSEAGYHRKDIKIIPDQIILSKLKEMNMLLKITEQDFLLQAKNKRTCNVKIPSDTDVCYITSVCYLADESVILCDENNKKLKHLDSLDSSSYTVSDYYELPSYPWQACPINKKEVAVSLYKNNEIHFISHSNKMRKTNQIKTDFECYGLAHADGNLYISDGYSLVYVYSVSGIELQCINMDLSGQFKFDMRNLAVSEDGSRMYVTFWSKGFIILDNNGQVVRNVNGPELQKPWGIFQTSGGSLLVASVGTNNVLQYGPTGRLIGEVIKPDTGKSNCSVVVCNQQTNKMIIGRYDENDIEVYDIV